MVSFLRGSLGQLGTLPRIGRETSIRLSCLAVLLAASSCAMPGEHPSWGARMFGAGGPTKDGAAEVSAPAAVAPLKLGPSGADRGPGEAPAVVLVGALHRTVADGWVAIGPDTVLDRTPAGDGVAYCTQTQTPKGVFYTRSGHPACFYDLDGDGRFEFLAVLGATNRPVRLSTPLPYRPRPH